MKKFTVVVPCYNVEDYLCRCLDSLVHQDISESDYEVIAVDDGSTDSTGEICDRYAKEYPQVKVMHQANEGVSAARNNGMSMAQGQYLYFVDGDDFVAENCFKALLHIAETNALDVVMFDFKAVNPDTPVPTAQSSEVQEVKVITGKEFLTDNCLHGRCVALLCEA
ncbi:MAG: glycosyltransferase [Porphyromonadaceae bacterium]|nr:MAG: glycosyltransferase [Porphyromonadaceae bacterium]